MMSEPNQPARENTVPRQAPKCPICGKPPIDRYRPFCSKRCAEVDLHRWLTGAYAIPVVEEDASAEGEPPGED